MLAQLFGQVGFDFGVIQNRLLGLLAHRNRPKLYLQSREVKPQAKGSALVINNPIRHAQSRRQGQKVKVLGGHVRAAKGP